MVWSRIWIFAMIEIGIAHFFYEITLTTPRLTAATADCSVVVLCAATCKCHQRPSILVLRMQYVYVALMLDAVYSDLDDDVAVR